MAVNVNTPFTESKDKATIRDLQLKCRELQLKNKALEEDVRILRKLLALNPRVRHTHE
jgi:hypothetical protein